jgi:hypothetical protein
MQFIPDIKTYSGEHVYDKAPICIVRVFGDQRYKYRYIVRIFNLEYSIGADQRIEPQDLVCYVVKNNPLSGYDFLREIINKATESGKQQGRAKLQNQIKDLLDIPTKN